MILSILFVPWWVCLIFVIPAIFYFKNFYESVLLGILMDSIYGSAFIFDNFPYAFTLAFLVATFLISKIREKLIMY